MHEDMKEMKYRNHKTLPRHDFRSSFLFTAGRYRNSNIYFLFSLELLRPWEICFWVSWKIWSYGKNSFETYFSFYFIFGRGGKGRKKNKERKSRFLILPFFPPLPTAVPHEKTPRQSVQSPGVKRIEIQEPWIDSLVSRLVWIGHVFSWVLPLVLGLDAWVFFLNLQPFGWKKTCIGPTQR